MLITWALASTILLPFFGTFLLVVLPHLGERAAARLVLAITWLSSAASILALGLWIAQGAPPFRSPEWTPVSRGEYHFVLGLSLDAVAAVFLVLVQFTSGMVIRFSRIYLHREPGFGRFFAIVLMFRGAMCLLTLAGNLDLLFVGWEMVGLASFLLIAFYHERPQSVRNALKTFSVYRVADVGMLLGAYLEHTSGHTGVGLLLLLAAAGKSAQFPFSFWVPRAMEGPTPSSALFYGALSVHAGAYLLLRTYPLWGDVTIVHVCVGILGLLTAVLCTLFSRAQHTIKGQVGYASVTQVGLIFVELSLGLRWLALLHIAANALLRCYQLLVSPSAVAYLLRQQSSVRKVRVSDESSFARRFLPAGLRSTLYVFAISEGYLETTIRALFWSPIGRLSGWLLRVEAPIIAAGTGLMVLLAMKSRSFGAAGTLAISVAFMAIAVCFSMLSLGRRRFPAFAIIWVSGSYLAAALSIFMALHRIGQYGELTYALGIVFSCALALSTIMPGLLGKRRDARDEVPKFRRLPIACAFVGVLGVMGFPLLPTFFGEDMLLHGVFQIHRVLAVFLSSLFAFNGYLAMRAFAFVLYKRSRRLA